jgi:hypothetical protein
MSQFIKIKVKPSSSYLLILANCPSTSLGLIYEIVVSSSEVSIPATGGVDISR